MVSKQLKAPVFRSVSAVSVISSPLLSDFDGGMFSSLYFF